MRNFGNNSLQVSTDNSNRSNSSASNDSFSVEGNTLNNTQSNTLNNHNNGRKRAHSGQTKAHPMTPDSNENAGKRKDVSGITRPDLQRSVPTFLSKLYK
ncbi:hypothetical protein INT43_002125 [Umbelopsis isabellina]|uniref:Uncharacterized protein n=1 Tax=Mortierella isabellina TaxID=91625 RepID=A0A8H7PSV6_MORIS|nr:hypothetical protein INT43_002125 [Umbelopsis isabellina]